MGISKKTAIRPNFFAQFSSIKKEEAKEKGPTEEERMYYGMSQTSGWKLFNNKVEELLEEMDQVNDAAVATGQTLEEIGKNTVVLSLAKGIIKRLINVVEDAKEACEGPEGGK